MEYRFFVRLHWDVMHLRLLNMKHCLIINAIWILIKGFPSARDSMVCEGWQRVLSICSLTVALQRGCVHNLNLWSSSYKSQSYNCYQAIWIQTEINNWQFINNLTFGTFMLSSICYFWWIKYWIITSFSHKYHRV